MKVHTRTKQKNESRNRYLLNRKKAARAYSQKFGCSEEMVNFSQALYARENKHLFTAKQAYRQFLKKDLA